MDMRGGGGVVNVLQALGHFKIYNCLYKRTLDQLEMIPYLSA